MAWHGTSLELWGVSDAVCLLGADAPDMSESPVQNGTPKQPGSGVTRQELQENSVYGCLVADINSERQCVSQLFILTVLCPLAQVSPPPPPPTFKN